jgi:hypothetical protein
MPSRKRASNRLASPAVIEKFRCPHCQRETQCDVALMVGSGDHGIRCECGQILDRYADDVDVVNFRSKTVIRQLNALTARTFLLRLANMYVDWDKLYEASRLVECYPEFFPSSFRRKCLGIECGEFGDPAAIKSAAMYECAALALLYCFQGTLRKVWNCYDKDVRSWRLQEARSAAFFISGDPNIERSVAKKLLNSGPPPKDFFQQALLYLQARIRTARRCAYLKCAQEPYFFAEKPNQKYCSEVCSNAVRRESNKNWWDSNGAAWRKGRKKNSEKRKKRRNKNV